MIRKYFLLICSAAVLTLWASNSAVALEDEFGIDSSILNTELNIKGAYLIEKYLLKYNEKLEDFKDTYGIESDQTIDRNISSIKKLIYSLRKVQTNQVSKEEAEKAMQVAIDEIKSINKSMKIYLKNKSEQIKEETRLLQEKFIKLIFPFQKSLEKLIVNLRYNVSSDGSISPTEKKLLKYVDSLENESIKLRTLKSLTFRNKADLKEYLIGIIKNIKEGTNLVKKSF